MKKLIIDEDTVYEIDEECLQRKTEEIHQTVKKQKMRAEKSYVYGSSCEEKE